jgi:hypothetical protein
MLEGDEGIRTTGNATFGPVQFNSVHTRHCNLNTSILIVISQGLKKIIDSVEQVVILTRAMSNLDEPTTDKIHNAMEQINKN